MIPMILRLKLKSNDASFGFYLPLLLIYIPALPVYIILAVVYSLMLTAPSATKEARGYIKLILKSPLLLNTAKGLEVEVHSKDADVKMFLK